jgi:20S proteasome alpha/beta subunit
MTVCLGISCPSENAVVVAADRMVSGGLISVEFEHRGSKIQELTPTCVVMMAGNALAGVNLFRDVRARLSGEQDVPIAQIVATVKDTYIEHRLRIAEDIHLKGRGITVKEFYSQYVNQWPEKLVHGLDQQIQAQQIGLQVGLDLLIAGVDSEPHLYTITHPGTEACWDSLYFCVIGSGTPLAMLQWVAECAGPANGILDGIYVAHDAKRRSEAHPGVGKETDVLLIRSTGITRLSEDTISAIRQKQESHSDQELPDISELSGQLTLLGQVQGGECDAD